MTPEQSAAVATLRAIANDVESGRYAVTDLAWAPEPGPFERAAYVTSVDGIHLRQLRVSYVVVDGPKP